MARLFPLALALVVGGCQAAAAPASPVPAEVGVQALIPGGSVNVASGLPLGGGSTEIRKGSDVVGVGWADSANEHIYLFDQGITFGINAWDFQIDGLKPYSGLLSPSTPIDNGGGPVAYTYKPLRKCDGDNDCYDHSDGYAEHDDFIASGTGVWKTLAQRLGRTETQITDRVGLHAHGSMAAAGDWDVDDCVDAVENFDIADTHADELHSGGSARAWQLTAKVGNTQKAFVAIEAPGVVDHGEQHVNAALPQDTDSDGKVGTEWCNAVDQVCTASCKWRVVTFTYP